MNRIHRSAHWLAVIAALAFICSSSARAHDPAPNVSRLGVGESLGFSPFWQWRTITTEHFRLSFPAELTSVAQRAALYFEQTHALLSPVMKWDTPHRTQIVLTNNQDSANGLTSPIQRFGIVLFVTPPDAFFSTDHYDDWLRLLVVHEYTHLLNMDATASWVYNALRFTFGDLFLPNSDWPSWMLEGYAVFMETRYTKSGRGRSPYWDMLLRERVQSGKLGSSDSVTLDRVNGNYPWWPSGEVPYLYGYELVNKATRAAPQGEKLLGEMSIASAGRVPFFINGNLENLSGKTWYDLWDRWLLDTEARAKTDLEHLSKTPFTHARTLTNSDFQVLGSAVSPDSQWLAYTEETTDESAGLWLRNLHTGERKRIGDKILGVGMSFTPDSKFLLFSSLRRNGGYSMLSEIGYVRVSDGKMSWITDGMRARDPDVSPDGKRILFSRVDGTAVGIAEASLRIVDDRPVLGAPRWLWKGGEFDRAANPKYLADGKRAVFSLHRNGELNQDIVTVATGVGAAETARPDQLVADGHANRFPAINPKTGELCYVSDLTGIDNVYCRSQNTGGENHQYTHVATGAWLPVFAPSGELYTNLYTDHGWQIAHLDPPMTAAGYPSEQLTIAPRPAPQEPTAEESPPFREKLSASNTSYAVEDYSAFPSIWPRQWAPILLAESSGKWALGGEVFGFDAADRHRYLLGGFYDTQTKRPDWLAYYSNRVSGANLNLYTRASHQFVDPDLTVLEQDMTITLSADLPLYFTHSSLVPQIIFSGERITDFAFLGGTTHGEYRRDQLVHLSGLLTYSDAQSSRLGVAAEEGGTAYLGGRGYRFEGEWVNWKLIGGYQRFLRLFDHWTLSPFIKYSHTARFQTRALNADTVLDGGDRTPLTVLATNPFEKFRLRGYAHTRIFTRDAGMLGADLNFPLLRIFRGPGTLPFFLQQFTGYAFAESAYFPRALLGTKHFLPAVGGGVRMDLTAFINLPLEASINYEKGLDADIGRGGNFYFLVSLPGLPF